MEIINYISVDWNNNIIWTSSRTKGSRSRKFDLSFETYADTESLLAGIRNIGRCLYNGHYEFHKNSDCNARDAYDACIGEFGHRLDVNLFASKFADTVADYDAPEILGYTILSAA